MGKRLTPEEAKAIGLKPKQLTPDEAKAAGLQIQPTGEAPTDAQTPNQPLGYVKTVDPDSEEARQADENTAANQKMVGARLKEGALSQIASAGSFGSLGAADELAGLVSLLKGKGFRPGQQNAEKTLDRAKKDAPEGQLLGALPYLGVGGAPTALQRMAAMGGMGAARGAASSHATLDQNPKQVIQDAGEDALTSAALQGGFELAGKGLGAAYNYAKDKLAPAWALKGAGLRGGIANRAQQIGLKDEKEALELGREFLDQGLIPPGGDKASVAARAEALRSQSGNLIGQAVQKGEMSGVPADYNAARWAAIDPAMKATVLARTKQGGPIRDLLRALAQQAEETPGSWEKLHQTKSDLGKSINWKAQPSGAPALARQSYGSMTDDFARQLESAAGPDAAKMFREGNKGYATASKALALSNDQGLREMANQGIGLKDVAAGIGGSSMGAAPKGGMEQGLTAAAITALSKLLRERGPSLGANLADVAAPAAALGSEVVPASGFAGNLTTDEETKRKLARYLGLLEP